MRSTRTRVLELAATKRTSPVITAVVAVAIASLAMGQAVSAAKLTPIGRDQANAGIAACRADPDHFVLSHGNWTACCVEDVNGKASCIVCTSDERCSSYEEFGAFQDVFNLLELGSGLELAPIEDSTDKPESDEVEYQDPD